MIALSRDRMTFKRHLRLVPADISTFYSLWQHNSLSVLLLMEMIWTLGQNPQFRQAYVHARQRFAVYHRWLLNLYLIRLGVCLLLLLLRWVNRRKLCRRWYLWFLAARVCDVRVSVCYDIRWFNTEWWNQDQWLFSRLLLLLRRRHLG